MEIFGLTISRTKAAVPPTTMPTNITSRGGWWPVSREPFSGAWQRNISWQMEDVLGFGAVYACVTLIASDIGKIRIKLVELDANGIWTERESPAFSPVLRKPNHYQIRIKFIEQWLTSKLIHGNTYVLKQRDQRGVVTALYVLDPQRVRPLVAANGDVYYAIQQDALSHVSETDIVVPAMEIIHDVMVALYHPLCGVSPLTACGLAAVQGLRVQNNSAQFFGNASVPSGILTSPATIPNDVAKDLKERWEQNYSGDNVGRVAVLGNDLKYEKITMTAVDAQLIDQLKWTAENVCTAYHVPPYMIGVGPAPTYNNIEALNQQYYAQCLQTLIETIELLLDEGLGLDKQTPKMGTEFEIDSLLRMDTATRVKAAADSIGSGAVSPNEARKRYFDLGPTAGGETPYLQQQNFSLAALAKRDAQPDPFAKPGADAPAPAQIPAAETDKAVVFSKALQAEYDLVCLK